MSVEAKICGLSTPETVDAAVEAGAGFVGFVTFPRSPRHIESLDILKSLGARVPRSVTRVGLFVDADDAVLGDAVAAARLDALQLHGEETPARAAQLRARFGLPVWKALPIASAADVERAAIWAGAVDRVLFDAKTPKGTLPGGMGVAFDWSLLAGWKNRAPWGLAGGLTPANVVDAARQTGAPLVDTSSGVETEPGVKDVGLVAAFCRAARSA